MSMRRQRAAAVTNFVSGGVMNSSPAQTRQSAVKPVAPESPAPASAQYPPAVQTPVRQTPVKQPAVVKAAATPQVAAFPQQQQPQQQQNQQPPAAQAMDTSSESVPTEGGEDGVARPFRRMWSVKRPAIRTKERRIRQNRRLRKILLPKNALMALHELKNVQMSEFTINNRTEGGFSAKVTVNNMQYEGIGKSKTASKNNACEKALRDHIIYTMMQAKNKEETKEKNGAETNGAGENTENTENAENGDGDVEMKTDVEDNIPMLNLASFAIYKLFSEWESEGFQIPDFRPNTSGSNDAAPATPTPAAPPVTRSELPANWETMHPASLLLMMRPGVAFNNLGPEGQPPNVIQRISVCVDNQVFAGVGRSQKIARRNAATEACNKLFNTNFQFS